jgi:putative acetyltransferase
MGHANNNGFNLRPIELDDNEAMAAVIREVMTSLNCHGPGFAMQDAEVDCLAQSYDSPKHRYFVLSYRDQVLGGAGIAPLAGAEDGVCELRKMYFLPAARGRGLGTRLGELCLQTAREFGYRSCYLETLEFMTDARRLYEKLGFERLVDPLGQSGHFGCDAFYTIDLTEEVES